MLLTNKSYINQTLGKMHSGATISMGQYKPEVMFNRFFSEDINVLDQIQRDSFPTGTEPPYSYLLGPKGSLISATTTVNGSGNIAGSLAQGINIEANLSGSGTITTANLSLIVQLACTILSSGTISNAALIGKVEMAASLAGSGNITSSLNLIANIVSTLTGSGSLTPNLTGTANLEATISPFTPLSPENLAASVWNSLTASFNATGTMGEVMNNMGSVSDPWTTLLPGPYLPGTAGDIIGNQIPSIKTNTDQLTFTNPGVVDANAVSIDASALLVIAESVWSKLTSDPVTADSYGELIQDLERLIKQVKSMTAANL